MTDLQVIEKDGEMLADSRDVAEKLGIEHRSLIRSINANIIDIKGFGILRFEIAEIKGRGQPEKYALLNEDQALFVGTLCRNSKEVVAYKAWLVRGFQAARKMLLQPVRQLSNIELAEMFIKTEKEKIELERLNSEKNRQILQLEHKNDRLLESDQIVQRFMSCNGLIRIDDVAKIAGIRLKRFYKILKGVVLKNDGTVYANLIATGKVELRPIIRNNQIHTETFFTPTGAVWFYRHFIKRSDDIRIKTYDLDM